MKTPTAATITPPTTLATAWPPPPRPQPGAPSPTQPATLLAVSWALLEDYEEVEVRHQAPSAMPALSPGFWVVCLPSDDLDSFSFCQGCREAASLCFL